MVEGYKGSVELKGCKVTFEGTREFVDEQISRWMQFETSKQIASKDSGGDSVSQPSAGITERDLVLSKHPSNHLETVAVLSFALTESGVVEFSEDDLRRAYVRAGVRPPKVMAQALRDAKNKMDYLEPGSKRGFYRLSPHGDRTVRFDLPRS
jgi:hypothetical protein